MKRMCMLCLLLLFGMLFGTLSAAEKDNLINISGKVVTGSRHRPVNRATVQLSGGNISTVTNSDGVFILKIPLNTPFTHIEIKCIGYSNLIVNAHRIALDKQNLFILEPHAVQQEEAVKYPVTAEYIVKQAWENIANNYGKDSLAKIAFYRESVKKGRRYLSFTETALDIEKASYSSFSPDLVRLYRGRKITNYRMNDTLPVKFKSGIISLIMMDVVKKRQLFFDEEYHGAYEYELDGTTYFDNRLHYIVSFNQIPNTGEIQYEGKIYIDAENYAIIRTEFNMNVKEHPQASEYFIHKKPSEVKIKIPQASYIVDFRKIDGDYSFHYAKLDVKYRCKWKRKWIVSKYTVGAEVIIPDETDQHLIIRDNLVRIHAGNILTENSEDFKNEAYWSAYNIVEPDKQVEKTIGKLVRRASKSHSRK